MGDIVFAYPSTAGLHVAGALLPQVFLFSVFFYRFQFVLAVGDRNAFDSNGTLYDTPAGFFFREEHVRHPAYRIYILCSLMRIKIVCESTRIIKLNYPESS